MGSLIAEAAQAESLRHRLDEALEEQDARRNNVIVYTAFHHGDVALFMPLFKGKGGAGAVAAAGGGKAPNYVAFHKKQPRYYLSTDSVEMFRSEAAAKSKGSSGDSPVPYPPYILGKIVQVQEYTAEAGNRFDLKVGQKYWLVDVSVV